MESLENCKHLGFFPRPYMNESFQNLKKCKLHTYRYLFQREVHRYLLQQRTEELDFTNTPQLYETDLALLKIFLVHLLSFLYLSYSFYSQRPE